MQHFDEVDLAELAQVAREEHQPHGNWYDRIALNVSDECIVSDDEED